MRNLLKYRIFYPVKKIGSILATMWPWPVPTKIGSRLLYVDLRSSIGRGIFVTGKFDDEVFEAIRSSISDGSVFIDAGANIGYYSLLAIDCVGKNGEIHSFEIDPRPLACLRKTIRKNMYQNIILHEVALGENDGVAYLQMQKDCGHSSAGPELQGCPVRMANLDSFLTTLKGKRVSGVKIDVEGGELSVLYGAKQLIACHRPVIVCEVVEDHLQRHGHSTELLIQYIAGFGYSHRWLEGVHTPTIIASPRSHN
jgi:FkbM family methyltransferase